MAIKLEETLNVASWNIRGLRNPKKRKNVIKNFHREKLDIVSLQETYLETQGHIDILKDEWKGMVHYSAAAGHNSMGLVTLFHPKYNAHNIEKVATTDRIILSSIMIIILDLPLHT